MIEQPDTTGGPGGDESIPGLRVLVIEDNEDDIILTRNGLHRAQRGSFEVEWAQTLAEGMDRIRSGGIDVVLLDLCLPDSQGAGSFDRLTREFGHLPIVVLSGNEDEELAVQTVRHGAQDYLPKSQLNPDTLGRVVTYAYERKKALERMTSLSEELSQRNALLREELELAHEIQRALLPGPKQKTAEDSAGEPPPWTLFHRYLPIDTLAGDFFKVYPLSDGRIGVLICDVMGHGVRSALIAALLSGLVEEYEFDQESPAWMLTRLNTGLQRVLGRCRRADMFATACYIVADPQRGRLEVCSAGHPAPFLVRAADGEVERLDENHGPALGLFDDAEFPECATHIAEDDFLLLFTDGLSELETAGGTFFETRIADVLNERRGADGDSLLDGLIDEARRFCVDGRFFDDVCLVGLRVGRAGGHGAPSVAAPAEVKA